MIAAIRSEIRKLLTVRSTYVIMALCIGIAIFFAFYIEGFRAPGDIADPGKLASEVTGAAQALGLFIALAGVLLMTHEYRYNTIMYTLTAARSRSHVLLAKIIAVSLFSVLVALVVCTLAPFLTQLGLNLKGVSLAPQDFPLLDLLGRSVLYIWGYSMLALIIAIIARNQVVAIIALVMIPSLGESLLGLLLKANAKYLPFSSLNSILQGPRGYPHDELVLLAYIVGGAAVAWLLFLRRDAN